jgi:hypothetical protein
VVDGPESIGFQFRVIDPVLVLFIEDEMEDSLGLNVPSGVGCPDFDGCQLVELIVGLELRYDDKFF